MIEIVNRQTRHRVNAKHWREFTAASLKAVKRRTSSVSLVFVSDGAIRRLNQRFRGQNRVTDVLAFPARAEAFETRDRATLGEIVISIDRAATQAKTNGLTMKNEIEQLILHGLLHLCGYDHETDDGEMNRLELRLRKRLGI